MNKKIWQAKWIVDPEFLDLVPIHVFHKEQEPVTLPPHRPELRNKHMFVRKTLTVLDTYSSAFVDITADDYYKLYDHCCVQQFREVYCRLGTPTSKIDINSLCTRRNADRHPIDHSLPQNATRASDAGHISHHFVLPLNAPDGQWKIEAREAISGLSDTQYIQY